MGAVRFFTDASSAIRDSLKNFTSGLGTIKDKRSASVYAPRYLSYQELVSAYSSSWIPRKIVDIPSQDAFRKWRDWQASKEEIGLIEAEEQRLNLQAKLLEAYTKARLFGGHAIYIATGQDPATELVPESLGKGGLLYLNVIRARDLGMGETERNPESLYYGRPVYYTLANEQGETMRIHPSRIVVFEGVLPADTDFQFGELQGWGESVLNSVYQAMQDADSTAGNIAAAVFEMKMDIVRVPNLMEFMADDDYRERLLTRMALAQTAKSTVNTLILDKDEEFETKTISLSGMESLIFAFMQIVAGAADIPIVRFLSQSPAGLNATGESDLKNYYDHIASIQSLRIGPAIRILDECLIHSALGTRPPELFYLWSSLWQVSDTEKMDIGNKIADIAKKLYDTNMIPQEALAKAIANALIEHGILPGLEDALDDLGADAIGEWTKAIEEETQAAEERQLEAARNEIQGQGNGQTAQRPNNSPTVN